LKIRTERFAYRVCFVALACVWTFSTGAQTTISRISRGAATLLGQFWSVVLAGQGELVRLTTRFRGPGICLDIFNGGPDNNQPHLAKCDDLSGQLWTLTKTDKRVEGAMNTNPQAPLASATASLAERTTRNQSLASNNLNGL
jgi:hypothetical protein